MQVHESNGGREQVVQSIVQVGFLLLEVSDGDRGEEDGLDKRVMSTEDIGVGMLKSLFEIHEMARTEVRSNISMIFCIGESTFASWFIRYDIVSFQFLSTWVR